MLTSRHCEAACRDRPEGTASESVRQLREALARYRRRRRGVQKVRPTGLAPLDAVLPGGGLPAGTVTEILTAQPGVGALTLALRAAGNCRPALDATDRCQGFPIADFRFAVERPDQQAGTRIPSRPEFHHPPATFLVDACGDFYPPAALALGIDLRRLWVVRPRSEAEAFWAVDQALRCPAVGSVVAWFERLDDRASRRLQLAAETGGGLGLLLRPAGARERSFAAVRMSVEPVANFRFPISDFRFEMHLHRPAETLDTIPLRSERVGNWESTTSVLPLRVTTLHLIKVREGTPVGPIVVDLNHETGDVPVLPVPADRSLVAAG